MSTDKKDTILGQGGPDSGLPIKSTKFTTSGAKSLTNGRRLEVSFTQQGVAQLIQALEATAGNERGTKLSIHFGDKEYNGKTFQTSFIIVGEIGEPVSGGATRGKFKARVVEAKKVNVPETL